MKRVLTAVLLTPLIVAAILAAPTWLFMSVVTIIALLCFYEYGVACLIQLNLFRSIVAIGAFTFYFE